MLINTYLQNIIQTELQKGSDKLYIRSLLKEYLQVFLLEFIYTHQEYKLNLIFTGGTCLRHFYGLERLSEDLDFDFIKPFNVETLKQDIQQHFSQKLKYPALDISIKQRDQQVLLKFPILKELGLANQNESELLYIKSDLSKAIKGDFQTEKTAKSLFGINFVALHYSLVALFSGKVAAVLTRNLMKGKENRQTIKGRDFYDLLWFLKREVKVDLELVRKKTGLENLEIAQLKKLLDEKVKTACTTDKTYFKNDLVPFISNFTFVSDYVDNYFAEYSRLTLSD